MSTATERFLVARRNRQDTTPGTTAYDSAVTSMLDALCDLYADLAVRVDDLTARIDAAERYDAVITHRATHTPPPPPPTPKPARPQVSAEALRYLMDHERDCFSKAFQTSAYRTNSSGKHDPILDAINQDRWKKASAALDRALALYLP